MKNNIFLFATFVFVSLSTFASTSTSTYNRYNDYGDSFTFVERGVTFSVFQNGEFDFYINPRNGLHVGYQGNGLNISFNSGYNYDAYVQYDTYGAIIQIENIPIYYDYYGRVDRIGNINLNYSYGRLARLGSMYVHYNNYGSYSHCSGFINRYNRSYVYHPYHNNFARPLFDFRIVSYKPYRNHYKAQRYTYNRDHSRNAYYNSRSKRTNHSTRQRVATKSVPKRNSDNIARVDRNNSRSYDSKRTTGTRSTVDSRNRSTKRNTIGTRDSRDYSTNSSTRRNTTESRNSGNTKTSTKSTPERSVQQRRTITERQPVRTPVTKRTSTSTKRPVANQQRSRTVDTRKPASTKRKSSVSTKTSKPVKRNSRSTENSRKRRS